MPWAAVALAAVALEAPFSAQATVPPLPITRVEVVGDGQVDGPAVIEILGLKTGEPLDRRRLRQAIHALYARAEVERLRVETLDQPDGQIVTVRLSTRSQVSRLEIRAGSPLLRKRVEKWLGLEVGDRLSTPAAEAAQRTVVRKLRELGYGDPRAELYLDFHRPTNSVTVTVEVAAGEPEVVGRVVLIGELEPESARDAMPDLKPESRLSSKLVDRVRREVESNLRRIGYWESQVVGVDRRRDGAQVTLEARVDPGPRYQLELAVAPEYEKAVRNAIPDPAEEDLHPAQTEALSERIRQGLQEQGYALARVRATLEGTGGVRTLRVEAEPGRVRRVAEVLFPGARGVAPERLAAVVAVQPGPATGWRGRPVTDSGLETDRLALEEVFRGYGFVEVKVGAAILEPEGADAVRVQFPIEEGGRWLITDLRVEGLPVEAAARLEEVDLGLAEARPWNPSQLEPARRMLEQILADAGYPEGRVEAEVDTATPETALIVLRAYPGPFVTIGQLVIAGLTTTDESVVQRTIRRAGLVSGAPFSRQVLLEAQRKLYELGLFRRVELLPMPGQERRTARGLVVACEEGRQRSYLLGVGWNETDRLRLTLGWSHLNLLGGAHAVSAEVRFSDREERYQVGLREPSLPLLNVPGYMVIYRTFEVFATYSQLRRGLWIDAGERYRRPFRAWWRYEYQIVQPDAPDEVLSDLERENQEARIASITPTLEWDFRNDLLVPSHGTFSSVSLEYAFPAFSANAEFLKLQGRFSLYGRILDGVGAVGFRVGAITPLGEDTGVAENLQVPLNTRFFAGGASTHRAFRTDFLGVASQTLDENGDPIGGNALLLINLEYQRPLSSWFSGVVFLDLGNVWSEPQLVRAQELRVGAGVGLRVDTPAGPIRAEYGWKLDREPDESTGQFFVSFGIPF